MEDTILEHVLALPRDGEVTEVDDSLPHTALETITSQWPILSSSTEGPVHQIGNMIVDQVDITMREGIGRLGEVIILEDRMKDANQLAKENTLDGGEREGSRQYIPSDEEQNQRSLGSSASRSSIDDTLLLSFGLLKSFGIDGSRLGSH